MKSVESDPVFKCLFAFLKQLINSLVTSGRTTWTYSGLIFCDEPINSKAVTVVGRVISFVNLLDNNCKSSTTYSFGSLSPNLDIRRDEAFIVASFMWRSISFALNWVEIASLNFFTKAETSISVSVSSIIFKKAEQTFFFC